jgi:hypothetical protein
MDENDDMQAAMYLMPWEYKERNVTGPYARVVFDIFVPRQNRSSYYVLRDVKTEELAAYIVRLHNDVIAEYRRLMHEK